MCSEKCVRVVSDLVLLLPDDEGGGPVPAGDPAGELQPGVPLHHHPVLAPVNLCDGV